MGEKYYDGPGRGDPDDIVVGEPEPEWLRERRSSARSLVRSVVASSSSSSASASSRRLCNPSACAEPFGASSYASKSGVRELRRAWPKFKPGEAPAAAPQPSSEERPAWRDSRGLRMPCSRALWPVTTGLRESSRRCMPMKIMMKPTRRDTVFTGLSVLMPWKRIRDATMVAVEKQT